MCKSVGIVYYALERLGIWYRNCFPNYYSHLQSNNTKKTLFRMSRPSRDRVEKIFWIDFFIYDKNCVLVIKRKSLKNHSPKFASFCLKTHLCSNYLVFKICLFLNSLVETGTFSWIWQKDNYLTESARRMASL